MTHEEIFQKLTQIIQRNAPRNAKGHVLEMDTNLDQLGIDSAHRIDILLDTEDGFQIAIEESAFAKVHRFGDLVELVNEMMAVPA
jgi:acyl carrier protein